MLKFYKNLFLDKIQCPTDSAALFDFIFDNGVTKYLWRWNDKKRNLQCFSFLLLNHHLIKNHQLHDAEKRNAKELYPFSIFFKNTKPTSSKYVQDYLSGVQLVWRDN